MRKLDEDRWSVSVCSTGREFIVKYVKKTRVTSGAIVCPYEEVYCAKCGIKLYHLVTH